MICIIPARKGSKRIPDKNMKPFFGKPIIEYAIEAAKEADIFDSIILATDISDYIHNENDINATGIIVYNRREKNAQDSSTLLELTTEVYYKCNNIGFGMKDDTYCILLPCNPFVTPKLLQQGYNIMTNAFHDAVYPVIENDWHIEQTLIKDKVNIKMKFPEYQNTNSNEWLPTYRHASMFFMGSFEKAFSNNTLVPEDSYPLIVDEWESQDIDTMKDWKSAEKKYALLHLTNS